MPEDQPLEKRPLTIPRSRARRRNAKMSTATHTEHGKAGWRLGTPSNPKPRGSVPSGNRALQYRRGGCTETNPNKAKRVKYSIMSEMCDKFIKQSLMTYPFYFQRVGSILGPFFEKLAPRVTALDCQSRVSRVFSTKAVPISSVAQRHTARHQLPNDGHEGLRRRSSRLL